MSKKRPAKKRMGTESSGISHAGDTEEVIKSMRRQLANLRRLVRAAKDPMLPQT
jgi:hypothetical protein